MASEIKEGTRVTVHNDGDNAEGCLGTVSKLHRSGRLTVDMDMGGFRSLRRDQVKVVE